MRKLVTPFLALLLLTTIAAAQNTNSPAAAPTANANVRERKPRGPVFRATKEQIKQTQALLKQRGHYAGAATGKLDDDTRAGLRKFQTAENLKVTGTLNAATLDKLGLALTDRQREIMKAQDAAKPANANSR
jgi:peptidoglycan hydrolase-like protein with peptidoglycan-binding domain